MFVYRWTPITHDNEIPPLGDRLSDHINSYKGEAFYASCSVWSLLYKLLIENKCPVGEITFSENGKPYFTENNVYFSLSHSNNVCGVAISDCPVGVDIEKCRDNYRTRLIEMSLTKNEKMFFDGDFTKIWCRKEAVVKMTGEGMVNYPNTIETLRYHFNEEIIEYKDDHYWFVSVRDPLRNSGNI